MPLVRLGLFLLWLALVAVQIAHHAVWRDEVRALSFALQGDDVIAMLRGLRGDAHPALWHLLLRGAHAVTGRIEVLQGLALLIGAAAMALFLWRAPFGPLVLGLFAFGHAALFEYVVMARNYGISMLLMFAVAALWPRRGRGVTIGVLLALLANTNVHSAFLAALSMGLWLFERGRGKDSGSLKLWLANAAIVAVGGVLCVLTVYPTFNDAVVAAQPQRTMSDMIDALLCPAPWFEEMVMTPPVKLLAGIGMAAPGWLRWVMSGLMFASLLGLVRRPALLLAGLAGLLGLSLLFCAVYIGFYRHEALWLVFLLCLYWIALGDPPKKVHAVEQVGRIVFALLLALQVPSGIKGVVEAVRGAEPFSRSRDFGRFVHARPVLHDAILIADPDMLLEPLPYYLKNPTYLMRQNRYGAITHFTRHARLALSLDDFVAKGRELQTATGRPVLILLRHRLDPQAPGALLHEGYNWTIDLRQDQVRRFLAATRMIKRFAPAKGDESFDVYWVKPVGPAIVR